MRRVLPILLGLTLLTGAGCSSLGKKWTDAVVLPTATNSVAGAWEGIWRSGENGHTGRLRCILTPTTTNGVYQAQFHATFWKLFSAGYKVNFTIQPTNGYWLLSGEQNLGGLMGGVYKYDGKVTPTEFKANYKSSMDQGIFEMSRPKPVTH